MSAATPRIRDDEAPGHPAVCFGRSADGYPVALAGETAFAMVPARNGRHYIVTGWRIRRPMAEWTRSDFWGHAGEAAFRAHVEENALHQQQRVALGRREIHSRAHTPWGTSQGATVYAEGVVAHSTAGHGGFICRRSEIANSMTCSVPTAAGMKRTAIGRPSPNPSRSSSRTSRRRVRKRRSATGTRTTWEAIHGRVLEPGQSAKRDERAFFEKHTDDWVVVSAIRSEHQAGFTEVIATPGGKRGPGTEERRFLVPTDEYHVGRFGFVIDVARHRV